LSPLAPPPRAPPKPPPQKAPAAAPQDPMTAFVLASGSGAALVQVNALFNTPLFDRLRECLPEQFKAIDNFGKHGLGLDPAYDIDRIAVAPEGMAMTGFFEGKPVAEKINGGSGSTTETYRGATIYTQNATHCSGQLGNLVVSGSDCKALIDRALTPAPANAA